jgi:hypothetical protein
LIILNTKGKIKAVYKDSMNAVRRKIPQEIKLPKNKNINLVMTSLISIIMNTDAIRIRLLSNDTFLDKFMMRKLDNGNKRVFIPNAFIERASFKIPAKILKNRACLTPRKMLTKTTLTISRSGFTFNILM